MKGTGDMGVWGDWYTPQALFLILLTTILERQLSQQFSPCLYTPQFLHH